MKIIQTDTHRLQQKKSYSFLKDRMIEIIIAFNILVASLNVYPQKTRKTTIDAYILVSGGSRNF